MKIYDVIIIGGGPAGASAGLYAARGGLSVCVLHTGAGALCRAHAIQNYYGTGTVTGEELYKKGLSQLAEVGAEVLSAEVTAAAYDGEFCVSAGEEYRGKRLVIATGAARSTADIPGLKKYEGKGVSYCAVCDAFFCRKKRVAVLGAGEYAAHELSVLSAVAGETFLFTDGAKPSFEAKNTDTRKIAEIYGGDRISGVRFADGGQREVDALFVALGVLGADGIAKSMGVLTDAGGIKTDGRGMTNIPGLYAAGDCTAGIKQVASAVAEGMNVGLSLISDLKGGKK